MRLFRVIFLAACMAHGCVSLSLGQDTDAASVNFLRNVIPPSPMAASLGKYADWPVSLYTGLPSISVPLYEMKGRSMSVPITLNYHASGIKVGEVASWVGLGWSLDCGGVITRSVRGLPDELQTSPGYFIVRQNYSNADDLTTTAVNHILDSTYIRSSAEGTVDTEQDLYSFNALGKSYKLLYKGGKFITTPFSNVKIDANFATKVWNVTLEDGTLLTFGGANSETSTDANFSSEVGQLTFPSAWYLSTVTTTVGEVFKFSYHVTTLTHETSYFESDYISYADMSNSPYCLVVNEGVLSGLMHKATVYGLALDSIGSDLERLEFVTAPREDQIGDVKLSAVKVYSKLSRSYVDEFDFSYVYSVATSQSGYTYDDSYLKRLKLTRIDHGLASVANKPSWRFDYNSLGLPSRASYAQDHWGYYNGATDNPTLLPPVDFVPQAGAYPGNVGFHPPNHLLGGNREPDSTSMSAEMLQKITFPTGGYSSFQFEPNMLTSYGEKIVKKSLATYVDLYHSTDPVVLPSSDTTTFTITQSQTIVFNFGGHYNGLTDITSLSGGAILKNPQGQIISGLSWSNGKYQDQSQVAYVPVDPGTYTVIVNTSLEQSQFENIGDALSLDASIQYTQSLGIQPTNTFLGGLRIKSIVDSDGGASPAMERDFQYENPLVLSVIDQSDYQTNVSTVVRDAYGPGSICRFVKTMRNATSKYSNGTVSGGTVGYGKVTTFYGNNGKTVSYFNNEADTDFAASRQFPYPPPGSRDLRRGLLLSKTDYTAGGVPVHAQRVGYAFGDKGYVKTLKAGMSQTDPTFPNSSGNVVVKAYYTTYVDQVNKMTSTEVSYANGGQDSLVVTTQYYYDNPANTRAVRTETTDSQGMVVKMISRTPLEKADIQAATPLSASASAAIDDLVNRNILNPTLQVEQYKGGTLINRSTTQYKTWSSGITLPELVNVQNGANAAETRMQFLSYDVKGNLRGQQKTGDVKHGYVYDYHQSYPVAEVVNADASSIAYTGFESDGSGNWVLSAAAAVAGGFTGDKGYSLSSHTLTASGLVSSKTYVVTLWAKAGATITINGTTITSTVGRNGWNFYKTNVSSATTVTVSGSGTIDDVRLYPAGAQMTTYTYGPYGMTSATNANQESTYFEYDGLGRPVTVRDHLNKVLKKFQYHYKSSAQ